MKAPLIAIAVCLLALPAMADVIVSGRVDPCGADCPEFPYVQGFVVGNVEISIETPGVYFVGGGTINSQETVENLNGAPILNAGFSIDLSGLPPLGSWNEPGGWSETPLTLFIQPTVTCTAGYMVCTNEGFLGGSSWNTTLLAGQYYNSQEVLTSWCQNDNGPCLATPDASPDAVPEPASIVLIGIGLTLLLAISLNPHNRLQ